MSSPAVSISMLLLGSRDSAGTNVAAPMRSPKTVVPAAAATNAATGGQPSTWLSW